MNNVYARFADLLAPRAAPMAELMARHLASSSGLTLFDAGFGGGALTQALAESGQFEISGAERDVRLVAQATARSPRSRLLSGDAFSILRKEARRYDVIVASHLYYYFPYRDWWANTETLLDHLNKDGRLAIIQTSRSSDLYNGDIGAIMFDALRLLDRVPRADTGFVVYAEDIEAFLRAKGLRLKSERLIWPLQLATNLPQAETDRHACEFLAFIFGVGPAQLSAFLGDRRLRETIVSQLIRGISMVDQVLFVAR